MDGIIDRFSSIAGCEKEMNHVIGGRMSSEDYDESTTESPTLSFVSHHDNDSMGDNNNNPISPTVSTAAVTHGVRGMSLSSTSTGATKPMSNIKFMSKEVISVEEKATSSNSPTKQNRKDNAKNGTTSSTTTYDDEQERMTKKNLELTAIVANAVANANAAADSMAVKNAAATTTAAATTINPDHGPIGCYLVYESSSGGRLMLYYSLGPVPNNAVGFFAQSSKKKIQGFKFKQAAGRSELIKGIAGGDSNRRKYYIGWCQFCKLAKSYDSTIIQFDCSSDSSTQGVPVDIYGYVAQQNQPKLLNLTVLTDISTYDAVAVMPKHHEFLKGVKSIGMQQFLELGNLAGATTTMN